MAYTWEDVMLGVDIQAESRKKQKKMEEIARKREKESTMGGLWSLGLSVLGSVFGPVGSFAGKVLGRYGADLGWFGGDYSDWEADAASMELGKFHRADIDDYKEMMKQENIDETWGQAIDTVIDLGTMYVQAGGLTAEKGEFDLTTFGSGDAEWSVFGKGDATTALDPDTLTNEQLNKLYKSGSPVDWSTAGGPSKDYVPGLFEGGLKTASERAGATWKQDKVISSASDLGRYFSDFIFNKEEG